MVLFDEAPVIARCEADLSAGDVADAVEPADLGECDTGLHRFVA